MIRIALAAALMGSTIFVTACNQAADNPAATDTAASVITVTEPWSRETAQGQNAGGAFMTIANTGTAADRLIGGSTPVAGRVEIHTVSMDGGVMRMRQLDNGLEIQANGDVTLKPGSFHVMLMDLKEPLKAGGTVPLTLTFAIAGAVETELMVKPAGTMAVGMEHGEGDKPHG